MAPERVSAVQRERQRKGERAAGGLEAAANENARVTLVRTPTARATRVTAPGPEAAATAPRVNRAGRRGVHAAEREGTTRVSSHAPSVTTVKAAAAESAAKSHVPRPMRRT